MLRPLGCRSSQTPCKPPGGWEQPGGATLGSACLLPIQDLIACRMEGKSAPAICDAKPEDRAALLDVGAATGLFTDDELNVLLGNSLDAVIISTIARACSRWLVAQIP